MANPMNLIESCLTHDHLVEYEQNDVGSIELRIIDAAKQCLVKQTYLAPTKKKLRLPHLTVTQSPVLNHIFSDILESRDLPLEQCVKARAEFEVFKYYQRVARDCNAEGQFRIGRIYYAYGENENVPSFSKTGLSSLRKAAAQGHEEATYALCRYEGKRDERLESVVEEAIKEDMNARFRLGHFFYLEKKYQFAFFWLVKAARQNHTNAKYYLGRCYFYGLGIEVDIKMGLDWIEESGKEGDAEAQYFLGRHYFDGKNDDSSYPKKASEWFLRAANQGHREAKYYLGDCYLKGIGIEENEKLAIEYLREAANKGVVDAALRLSDVYLKNEESAATLCSIQQAELGLMTEWVQKAPEIEGKGASVAQYIFATQLQNGLLGLKQDLEEAKQWFQRALDAENSIFDSKDLIVENIKYSLHQRVKEWRPKDPKELSTFGNYMNRVYHNLFGLEKIIENPDLCKIYTFAIKRRSESKPCFGMLAYLQLKEKPNELGIIELGIKNQKTLYHSFFRKIECQFNAQQQEKIDKCRWGSEKLESNGDDVTFNINHHSVLEVEYKNEDYKVLIYPVRTNDRASH